MKDNYVLDILGALQQSDSKKQINSDIRQLEKTINMLRITGTFAKGSTKKELNAYIKSLQSQLNHVKLTAKIDNRNLKRQFDSALNGIKFKDIDVLNIDGNKAKLKIRKAIADVKAYAEKSTISVNIDSKKNKLSNDLISYLNKNTKINESSVLLQEAQKVRELIDAVGDRKTLREATDAFQLYKSEVSATGFATQSTTDKIKTMLGHVTKIGSAFGIASMAVNNFVKSLQTLKSNDTILTEISKTSEMTKQQLKELGDEAFKIASKYGKLSSDYLLGVQEMSRAGYENSSSMAELSTKAQGAGDMTAELANQYIIATDVAFKMNGSIEKLTATLDGANNITNHNAVNMTQLAEGMSVVGTQAASSQMEVNEITAAIGTMVATTQKSGREMGNAFRGILMNLQQVSGDVGDGEDIIDTESLTKYEKACAELGVSLSEVKNGVVSLREPMQILKELSEEYTKLDEADARRANLLSSVGGKYRANALNAILENYSLYEKMLQDYADGLGSMDAEAEKTANSWEGRLNSLQNSFDSFVNTLTNKDAIMGGISFFDRLLQGAEALTDTIGEIPVVLTTLNTAMVAMNKNYGITQLVNPETRKLDIRGNILGINFSAIKEQRKHFLDAEDAIQLWNDALLNGENNLENFGCGFAKNNAQFKDYLSTCKDAPASLKGYKAYLNQMGISTDVLRIKTIAMNAALSLGLGIVAQVAMKGFQLIGTAVDDYLHQLERQQEKLENALSAYEDVKSELENINSELDENKKKISELEAKPKLTYAEKGQLEELRQITEQLELQKEITEWQLGNKQKNAAMESVAYVNTKYNLGDSNVKDVDGLIPNILSNDHRSLDIAEDIDVTDAEYLAAAYRAVSGELENLIDKRKELSVDSQDAIFIDNDIETYKSSVEDVKTEINDMLSSLMEQKANIQDYYDTIKETPYEDMSTDARKCYDTMQQIDASIQTLYYGLGNNRLNSEVIDRIFNTEGIEVTKEKLVEMAQAGTLNPMTIAGYENLADAILNSNLIADEGCGLFETLCNEIYASAEASEKAAQSMSKAFSKSEMIDSINALSDGFDIIDKIYSDVKDKDVFDFTNLDSKKFQEAFGDLGVEYENFIEKVSESPNDINACQQAFNDLVSKYLEASGILNNLDEENAKVTASMLELMGITNAQELVDDALLRKKAELIAASDEYVNATDSEKQAIIDEIGAGEALEQIIAQITLQKQLANENALDTTNDINAIYSLAQTAGFGAEALYNLAEARAFLMEAEASGDVDQINEAKEAIRRIVSVEQQKLANFSADLQYTGADTSNKKSGGSSKSSSEKDLWLEEYKKKLEELKRQLNEGLITQKDFYYQSEALMDEYLKDSPAHLSKYAEEIADAENTLHDEWVKTLEYEKSELDKNVSDNILVQWQYYERLSELAEEYYNTAGASYGKFADEYDEITREIQEGQKKLWEDVFSELNSQLDSLQSACGTVKDAVEEYSENQSLSIDTVQKLVDLEPQYLAMLMDENGQLQLNEEAYAKLAKAKLEEMKVDLAYQTLNTINGLENEAQAVELLTGKYAELRDTSLGAVEAMLQVAVAEAHNRGEKQGQAADMMMQVYQNQKKVIDMADFSLPSLTGSDKDKEEKKFLKTFDWIGTLLEKISDKTSKLIDKVDKFYNWQKKNSMINRAVKSTNAEISQNERAYQAYMKKANSVGLSASYVNKVQNGTLSIQDITNEKLADKIDEYQDWYDKAQSCLKTIENLYDKQRDLIRQKLDNVLDYYSDMDSYLSSITSKIESLISLNDEMGKRSSLTELVEQFSKLSDQLESVTTKEIGGVTVTEGSLGDSKKVAEAVNRDRQKLADTIESEIRNLDVKESGNYTKLLDNIAKTQAQIDKYKDKGWDKSKAKSYENLQKKLQNYYDLQKALDENATSNTIANYEKTYTAYQRLQNKIDSGKTLSKSEQKSYDLYTKQLDDLKAQGQSALDKLYAELAEVDGTAQKQTEADKIQGEIDGIQSDLENTATYKNLLKTIESTESKLSAFDKKGYENLTKGQKKTYDKLKAQLEDYYTQKASLDENATASNIAEYNKIYLAWKKLQDKLDSGKNLSESQWKQYNDYTKQLENFADEKADAISKLNDSLEEALNPSDKLGQIEKTYEESAKGIYDSYQKQIDGINSETENTKQYQNIFAKAQKLEQKKDTKGLSKSEQATLDKYNAELEALRTGATGNNITDYVKTWEAWYKLQQKLDNGKKLSDSEAKKYDTYKAQLEAWNNEKQTQINDLLSLMEDDLEQLQKTYTENVSEAESEVNDYYANLYSLAKQIAEYNLTTLQSQLDKLDAYISYYKELVSLYNSFSGDKLTKILTDLDENALAEKADIYEKYLNTLQDKYNTTLSEMNEYSQLLDALDTNDFEASMDVFNKALESYKTSGDTVMADKLQSVLDLLNERAVDADNWGEFADQWAEEWEKAFASAKQELIGTATEIQEVNDALRNIRFENITNAISELDTAKEILSSIADLIQDDWMYDGGELSEYGRAKVALLVSQLEDSQKKANAYLDLINEIQNNKDTYASDKAYMEDLNNATQNYYNTLGETVSLENSIVDIMKKSAEEEINSLKNIIDARKKALQTKKEYYDYDKSLKNSQKEIDSIKAQIDAIENLSGAMDAATKAKLAQLKADLAEKEESLQETKDEHTYNLQIDALDEFVASLEDSLNSSTQSLEEIISGYQSAINNAADIYRASTDSVNDTLGKLIAFYSGMGTSIDGTDLDLTPNGMTAADGKVLTVNTSVSSDNKVPDAVNKTTEAVDRVANAVNNTTNAVNAVNNTTENFSGFLQGKLSDVVDVSDSQNTNISRQIDENTSKTAEIMAKYGLEPVNLDQIWKVYDTNLFDITAKQYETMVGLKQNVAECVRNRDVQQPVVINNHYDSLITVEGSVDKSFSKEFQQNSDEIYKGVVNRLTHDLKRYIHVPSRPSLPSTPVNFR